MPLIKLLHPACGHRAGAVIDVSDRAAEKLIERGKGVPKVHPDVTTVDLTDFFKDPARWAAGPDKGAEQHAETEAERDVAYDEDCGFEDPDESVPEDEDEDGDGDGDGDEDGDCGFEDPDESVPDDE